MPSDVDALLASWASAVTCPRWRLGGESPSPGLLRHLTSDVDHQQVLRDSSGGAVGLLQIVEVNQVSRFGHLSFLLGSTAEASILGFLCAALSSLDLRHIYVFVDDEGLGALATVRPHLVRIGRLREHTLASRGHYQDRHVFEFSGPVV